MTDGKEVLKAVSVDYDPFIDDRLALVVASTEAQKEIWSSIQMDEKASCAFNESVTLKLNGVVNQKIMSAAINFVINRHEILRATFSYDGQSLCIADSTTAQIQYLDAMETGIEQLVEMEAENKFDLQSGPLIRFILLKQSETETDLIVTAHHIICDGWSISIILNELAITYSAFINHQTPELAESFPFSQYARESEQALARKADQSYWLDVYAELPPQIDLPLDNRRPSFRSFNSNRIDYRVDADVYDNAKQLAAKLNCSFTSLMMSLFAICIHRWSGETDVVIGMPAAAQPMYSSETLVGHCVNLLPIRIKIDPDLTVGKFVAQVAEHILAAYEHQNYTFGSLLKQLSIKTEMSRIPLVPVLFNVDRGVQGKDLVFEGLKADFISNPRHYENFEIFINASDYGDRFILECQYNTDLFNEISVNSRLKEFVTVLVSVAKDFDQPVSSCQLLNEAERAAEINATNNTSLVWGNPALLQQRIDEVAETKPDAIAVSTHGVDISYQQLADRSNQFAHYLQAQGVGRGSIVGVCLERTENLMICLLAILKSGASYIPLDPQFPPDRIAYMIEDSAMQCVVTQQKYAGQLGPIKQTILTDNLNDLIDGYDSVRPESLLSGEDLAYIIYTSGSTGKPKGVMVKHGSVINFLNSMAQKPGMTTDPMLLAVTTLSFDIAVLELYLPLLTGGRLLLASSDEAKDGNKLLQLLQRYPVNIMQATPVTWRLLLSAGWNTSQPFRILCGGEALPNDLAQQLLVQSDDVWNMYGPTETTVWSSCGQVVSGQKLNIGEPITNTQLYILDQQFNPVPRGVVGELFIAGAGVSKGYLNKAELTAAQFVKNIFSSQPDELMYRTGDMVRRGFDGQLEILGRADGQIKLRGYRIETGEIESVIRQHQLVDDCAVAVKTIEETDVCLLAYIVWNSDETLTLTQLHQYLREWLPEYMCPQHIISLLTLPRTPNGKLDKKAMPDIEFEFKYESKQNAHVPAATETEQWLAGLWAEILRHPQISAQDNFFDLGGHSLLVAQLIQKIESDKSLLLQYADIFNYPLLSSLARHIDELGPENKPLIPIILPREKNSKNILSLAQQRLWYLEKITSGSELYNLPSAFKFIGALDITALSNSLRDMLSRHEILRTVLIEIDGEPLQKIIEDFEFKLDVLDYSEIEEDLRSARLQAALNEVQHHVFSLTDCPLFKLALFKVSDDEHVLFFMPHHMIFDGWSFDLFMHELTNGYCKHTNIEIESLPALPIQYADYALWQKENLDGDLYNTQLDYWVSRLKDNLPILEMPLDHKRPEIASNTGEEIFFEIDEVTFESISSLAKSQNVSLFMLMYSLYGLLLYRYTGQKDLVIGAPMADRTRSGTENLIGFFVNALVLRCEIKPDETFVQMLSRVRDLCLDGFANQDAPFEKLVEVLNPVRDFSRAPLFQTSLTYQDVSVRENSMGDIKIEQVNIPTTNAPLDINIWLKRRGKHLQGAIVYSKDLFERKTAEQITRHFVGMLESVAENQTAPVSKFPVLTTDEFQYEVKRNAAPAVIWSGSSLIHEMISSVALQQQDKIAAICEGEQISYRQLEISSNQFAHYLLSEGVMPGMLVGVCVGRSIKMLTMLVGVWKAGAAYVPIDPEFPHERISYMLEDASLEFVISESEQVEKLPQISHLLVVDDLAVTLADQPDTLPVTDSDENSMAYVIYTSGSTGKPKGVLVPHAAAANFLRSMMVRPGLSTSDKLLAVTTLSFDISVLELFLPLVAGAELVIASRHEAEDGRKLVKMLDDYAITLMQATPATWRLLISSGWKQGNGLKVLCGGEALSSDLAADILQRCDELWNMYGPTETTVWSSCELIEEAAQAIGIGQPIANTLFYVLDDYQQFVPQGVVGELYIGGAGVAKGYLDRPKLNAEAFIDDPIAGNGKMYKTGDRVRYRSDGSLEYIGRSDNQIKVRGYRIEPGEIETVLRHNPSVTDCAVAVIEQRAGDARLVVFVIWNESASMTVTEMRAYLREYIPNYMVPQHLIELKALPQTPNAKLDRKALPLLFSGVKTTSDYKEPTTQTEKWLTGLWQDALGVEQVSVNDNFFDIGGHSLLSISLVSEIAEVTGLEMNPRVFLLNSLGQIAYSIDSSNNSEDSQKENNDIAGSLVKKIKSIFVK